MTEREREREREMERDGHKGVHEKKDLNGNRAEISTPKLNKN